jgi:hypothetical protein
MKRRAFLILVTMVSAISTPAWAQGGSADSGASRQRSAKRRLHPGFLGQVGSPLLSRLRAAGIRAWTGAEQVAPRPRRRRQPQPVRRRLQLDSTFH